MGERDGATVDTKEIVAEFVGTRCAAELGERQTRIRHRGTLTIDAAPQRQGLAIADGLIEAQRRVGHRQVDVVARAVAFFVAGTDPPTGTGAIEPIADIDEQVAQTVVTAAGGDARFEILRCPRRDVVDQSADGLRAERDLTRILQHLDALETLEGRMVVARVVPIGRETERQAVLEQQHLGRACRVQTTDADVGAQTEPLFITRVHAGHLAQRFVHGEGPRFAQRLGVDHLRAAGQGTRPDPRADDDDFRQVIGGGGLSADGAASCRDRQQADDGDPDCRPMSHPIALL